MRTQNIILVLAILILAGSLLYIGNQLKQNGPFAGQNTINVMGEGKTTMAPDSMVISLSVSEIAATTQEAQTLTNTKVNKVKEILTANNIPASDIKTENIAVYEEYDWTDSGRKPLGYRSSQTITVTITDPEYTVIGGTIIDAVAQIGGVQVNNSYFAVKDKEAAMTTAREAAFADAKTKAEQLAAAGGLRIKKALSISDTSVDYYPGPVYPMMGKTEMAVDSMGMGGGADISAGEVEIRVMIQVIFETK